MWKKLIFKAISAAVVMAGLSLYAGYLTTGQLPSFVARLRNLATSDSGSPGMPSWLNIGELTKKSTDGNDQYEVLQGSRTTIYKWQDAKGVWQYGERAPLNGGKSTKVEVVTAASAPATKSAAEAAPVPSASAADKGAAPALVNPYSPDGVQQMLQKAREAQQQMNEHTRQQEQM